ncbi:MAG TPA: hypothetical protein VNR42_06400 [Solirubrobacteraceae bacterium]|nr:hypothetical protein [Solirubrobacteraceae bacterium]
MKRICVALLTALVVSVAAAPSASALTYAGAQEWSRHWAEVDSGWLSNEPRCEGPFENVKGKTQWACYANFVNHGYLGWQVNVGPYGEQTYHHFS